VPHNNVRRYRLGASGVKTGSLPRPDRPRKPVPWVTRVPERGVAREALGDLPRRDHNQLGLMLSSGPCPERTAVKLPDEPTANHLSSDHPLPGRPVPGRCEPLAEPLQTPRTDQAPSRNRPSQPPLTKR
jgi:hypothetical protein